VGSKSNATAAGTWTAVAFTPLGLHTSAPLVHQYLRPDGKVGGSGRPDPKAVLDGDTLYLLSSKS
jgi:hypothetical protein